jgi:uncharacterized protein DUF1298
MLVNGVGLNITVLSYRDKLDVGLGVDREQMTDVGQLVGCTRRSPTRRRRVAVASRGGRPSVNVDTPRPRSV